jgi:asparagine synthetase B (glutamine-hydrolysing)
MNNIFNIENYKRSDLIEMFGLSNNYTSLNVDTQENLLVESIIKNNILDSDTKRKTIEFINEAKQILMKDIDLTLGNIYNTNFYIVSKYFSKTYNDVLENVQTYLIKSVQKRCLSDRPIAALLSGGLDSSIICSILSKVMNSDSYSASEFSNFLRIVNNNKDNNTHQGLLDRFSNELPKHINFLDDLDTRKVISILLANPSVQNHLPLLKERFGEIKKVKGIRVPFSMAYEDRKLYLTNNRTYRKKKEETVEEEPVMETYVEDIYSDDESL